MNLHPKNHKVMFALVAVLFFVSVAQTNAILNLSKVNQGQNNVAQVKDSLRSTSLKYSVQNQNCLDQNEHILNKLVTRESVNQPQTHNSQNFEMIIEVTNNCNEPIYMVTPQSLNSNWGESLYMGRLERLNSQNLSETVILGQGQQQYGIQDVYELLVCSSCNGGQVVFHPAPSGNEVLNGVTGVYAFPILPGETQKINYFTFYELENFHTQWLRILSRQIAWFPESAANDNLITSSEIKKTKLKYATDYMFTLINTP